MKDLIKGQWLPPKHIERSHDGVDLLRKGEISQNQFEGYVRAMFLVLMFVIFIVILIAIAISAIEQFVLHGKHIFAVIT